MNKLNLEKFGKLLVFALLINLLPGCTSANKDANKGTTKSDHAANVIDLEKGASLDTYLQEHNVVIVDFYANWCGPCRVMKPIFVSMASQFPGVFFIKASIDDHMAMSKIYGVQSVPTFIAFKDGKKVDTKMGQMSADALREFITKNQ